MKNNLIREFENKFLDATKTHPSFRPGDSIRVHYRIEDLGGKDDKAKGKAKAKETTEKKFRIQSFEGICIRFKKGNAESNFTVRKIGANSVGVERIFPLHSPSIEKIELVSGGAVRRSRLYYLRERSGKAARIKSRRLPQGTVWATQVAAAPVAAVASEA